MTAPRVAAPVARGARLASLPPLSLYVHVPWCVRKCPYCDFNSHAADGDLPEAAYLAALQADLEQALPLVWGRPVVSVFIGGGTPSLLSAAALDQMLSMLRAYLPLLPDAEITLEANPGTAEAQRLRDFVASGVNRLSLGIQSLRDERLRVLGRIHDASQARAAVDMALRTGARVNLDWMFALPGQRAEDGVQELRELLAFGTDHVSLYQLTMEPNTVFAKFPPAGLPDDDEAARLHDAVQDEMTGAGWEHYEVSAFARTGQRCRHNVNYWEFGDYLGIGPGAHGKLSFPDRIIRQSRLRQPASWMSAAVLRDGSHLATDEVVDDADLPFEFMLNALRLREGVPAHYFPDRTGLPSARIGPSCLRAQSRGLLDSHPGRLQATSLGWRFLTDLQSMFLPDGQGGADA